MTEIEFPGWFQRHHESVDQQLDRLDQKLILVLQALERLIQMSTTTTNSLANLQDAVAKETSVDQSVLTLVTTLAAEIQAASPTGDNPAIDAVVATMSANAAALSAAVAANTPAAPVTPPVTPTP